MNTLTKILIIAAVATAVVAVLIAKQKRTVVPPAIVETVDVNESDTSSSLSNTTTADKQQTAPASDKLPTLLDLGKGFCIPCKMMAPILDQLKEEYQGKMNVVFVDIGKNPAPAKQHKIEIIPTQIFLDSSGKELFRHVGFYSKEQILGKWKELGFEFEQAK